MFDVVFIENNESNAAENYERLTSKVPWGVKKITCAQSILSAHKLAAKECKTEFFYVVDADTWVYDNFDFTFEPSNTKRKNKTTFIWYAKNPCNDLIYGHGGIKLLYRKSLNNIEDMPIDLTTLVQSNIEVIPECISDHRFNTDSFSTWRTAFRECVKLNLKYDGESIERLDVWTSKINDAPFSQCCLEGAKDGQEFAEENFYDEQQLDMINNYDWLKERFMNK